MVICNSSHKNVTQSPSKPLQRCSPPLPALQQGGGLRWPFCKDAAASLAKVEQSWDGLVSATGTGKYIVRTRDEEGVSYRLRVESGWVVWGEEAA